MKKKLTKTKCTAKLRKSEYYEEWYLIIESYPVFKNNIDKPQRIVEALNRTITTPIWDKSRTARTSSDGTKTFKPKRDLNGIIQCKNFIDQEACIFADSVRSIRQKEYDTSDLYTEKETELVAQNQRQQIDFIEYFWNVSKDRHKNNSQSIIVNWNRVMKLLKYFTNNQPLPLSQLTLSKAEEFKRFMLSAPCGGNKKGIISQNTAATYYSIFKAGLKQAFIDGYLTVDISAKIKGIKEQESRREHLSIDELNILVDTPCSNQVIKNAALFSALTGSRHCDIKKLKWKELIVNGNQIRFNFTQMKTKGVEYMPISKQAYNLCGEPGELEQLVFEELPDPSSISNPLKRWIKLAGITRNITFHCFRHTYATLQLSGGTDIYTVSKMLGHTNVKTTQIYGKVVDEKKQKATEAIKLKIK
jgi:integrase